LRAVNVGGKNKLVMADLKTHLAAAGLEQVATYIQSGNLVFKSEKSAEQVSQLVHDTIENQWLLDIDCLVFSADQWQNFLRDCPFPQDDGKTLHFYLLSEASVDPNREKLERLKKETESYQLGAEVFYLYAPEGIGRSKLAAEVEKSLGVKTTARNLNTVNKLSSLLQSLK
jgi:uncharacterized protein (DUF1697 family)